MKRVVLSLSMLFLIACAPVLDRQLMKQGTRDVPLSRLREMPAEYKGRLYILGGMIVNTRLTEAGSEIEALYVAVDSLGYLREGEQGKGRYLAVFPRAKGILDPELFKRGREITLAGEFVETRKGKIDEMEYIFPVFEIKQINLWSEAGYYDYPPYYYPPYPYYSSPFLYDRWGRPYPNPYWPPPPW